MQIFGFDRTTISRALAKLVSCSYMVAEQLKKIRLVDTEGLEKFHSPYKIEAVFPAEKMELLKAQADRSGLAALTAEGQLEYGLLSNQQEINPDENQAGLANSSKNITAGCFNLISAVAQYMMTFLFKVKQIMLESFLPMGWVIQTAQISNGKATSRNLSQTKKSAQVSKSQKVHSIHHVNELVSNTKNITTTYLNSSNPQIFSAETQVSCAETQVFSAKIQVTSAEMRPYYLIKDLILKNSIRDQKTGRVLQKNTAWDSDELLAKDSQLQNQPVSIAKLEQPAKLDIAVPLEAEQPLALPSPESREKILQLLAATKEKLNRLKSQNKTTGGTFVAEEVSLMPKRENGALNAPDLVLAMSDTFARSLDAQPVANVAAELMSAIKVQQELATNPIQAEVLTPVFNNIVALPVSTKYAKETVPQESEIRSQDWDSSLQQEIYGLLYHSVCKGISTANEAIAENYAKALSKKFSQKYKSWGVLFDEFKYYAATFEPRNFVARDKEKVALVNAWKLVIDGKWETPRVLTRFATLAREVVYHVEKYLEIGERAKTQDLQDLLAEISSKTKQRWDLEQLVELYQREERQRSKACGFR